ncbi:MAG: O-antigen ligase family protein [Nitrospira sp.]|nr:O-antigen ligase family protein [Nitrospira sp.]
MHPTVAFQGSKGPGEFSQSQPLPGRNPNLQIGMRPQGQPESKAGFYLVLANLIFEFGRPQDQLPGIKGIPFGMGLSILILLKVLRSGKINFSRLQTKLWIPLLGIMAIHVPIATNNFWALMTFKDMVLLYCVYLGIVTFVDSTEKMMTLMKLWVGIHGFLAVMGIMKGGKGIGSWMGDENDFCMVMDMAAPFAYFLMFSATDVVQRLKYLGVLGTIILGAMASLSRGGFMGLAAVGAYCWYRSPRKMNALIVLAVAAVFMVVLAPESYWDEIASSTSDETLQHGTGAERFYTWGIGMEMFYWNPIIGIGQSNFPWTFDIYQEGRTFKGRSIAGRQAHSAWVTLISELGLAGIIIIGLMFYQCYKDLKLVRVNLSPAESVRKHGQIMKVGEDVRVYLARAMEGSLIGFIVSGVFISILWYPSLWIMVAFVVALRNVSEGVGDETRTTLVRGVPLPKLEAKPSSPKSSFGRAP